MKTHKMNWINGIIICLFALSNLAFMNGKPADQNLESTFKRIVLKYKSNPAAAKALWNEIVSNYSGKDRHYHNMEHLQNFYNQLKKCKDLTTDDDLLIIAMVYHDVIYNSVDHKDEERSADMAVERLKSIGYPEEQIAKCKALILATKTHALSTDTDTNYFNDADMTILGLDRNTYETYVKNVRLEYGDTPQFSAGRKKVLQYFLGMERIFKTDFFYKIYEKSARENIAAEISTLP
ncbi:HD domain-containing protein [Pedobacter metabolipauper]|uniref:Putative metal-dependent HD superfamily phosphohydrolase n=1 Tax=Pedobacter metabolipauper TaxID=425513 RepID=A0A4V3D164_9SPHI|nr:hypothetical protein [Pedobacter metabolipauper]TDQ09447.1 putative metal-dependent HD superfamily phosphohydrolase [Pedobacter metabolipauper]